MTSDNGTTLTHTTPRHPNSSDSDAVVQNLSFLFKIGWEYLSSDSECVPLRLAAAWRRPPSAGGRAFFPVGPFPLPGAATLHAHPRLEIYGAP